MVLASPEQTCAAERLPILSAFYFPGAEETRIPPDITPVNIFRIVFNTYFDASMELEENRMFGVALQRPYDLHEFTRRLDWCPLK